MTLLELFWQATSPSLRSEALRRGQIALTARLEERDPIDEHIQKIWLQASEPPSSPSSELSGLRLTT